MDKKILAQTLVDIVKSKDQAMLEVCYDVAQYRVNEHFEKAEQIETMLKAYDGWVLYRINGLLTILALILFHFIPQNIKIISALYLLTWLVIFGFHSWVSLRRFRKALPYICVDELFCRHLLQTEMIQK